MSWSGKVTLAYIGSLILFGIGSAIAYFALLAVTSCSHEASGLFSLVLPFLSTLVLSIGGFYYRRKSNARDPMSGE